MARPTVASQGQYDWLMANNPSFLSNNNVEKYVPPVAVHSQHGNFYINPEDIQTALDNIGAGQSSGGGGGKGGGGGGEGEGGGGGYYDAINDMISQGMAKYNEFMDYAKTLMDQATAKSPYEDIYKGEYDTLNAREEEWYNKVKDASSLIPTDAQEATIQEILNPQYSKIREQKDEALRQFDAMQALAHRDVKDPEVATKRSKIAKQFDDAENELYSQYMYQYPRDEFNVLNTLYGNISNQAASYLSGATALDESRKNRMAGGSGNYLSAGTNMYGNTLNADVALKNIAEGGRQFDENMAWKTSEALRQEQLARDLADQYSDLYEDNNSWWNKLIGGVSSGVGGLIGGGIGGFASNLFSGGGGGGGANTYGGGTGMLSYGSYGQPINWQNNYGYQGYN